jgi:sigma-B regulation protein RsbU (phosphoserine phosphatase)
VAEGDLDFELPSIDQPDEVGALTNSFAQMRDSLRHYIDDLKTATAERQKLESELDIAAQIQRGMLRGESFVQEEPSHFEIAASLTPAKAVGGDFYDYSEMPESQLCVVVGDVSDKGVHAALFMARAITAVRSAVGSNWEPDQILHSVNQELCRNNEACMFATLFCAVQDLRFGYLRYASAGHDPSVLINAMGEARFLEGDSGTAVGLDEDAEYESHKIRLRAGDVVLLYTDGVTEAASVDEEMFGEERLLETVKGMMNADARKVLRTVAVAVDEFAAGAPQADDLTLLTLRYGQASDQDLQSGMQRLWKESSN